MGLHCGVLSCFRACFGKEIPRLQRRALAKSLNYYRDTFEDEKQGMAACLRNRRLHTTAGRRRVCVHYATVSRAVKGDECRLLFCKT